MSKRPDKNPKLIDRNNFNLPNMKKNPMTLKKQNTLTEENNNEIKLKKLEKIPPLINLIKEEKNEKKNFKENEKDKDKINTKEKDKKFFKFRF